MQHTKVKEIKCIHRDLTFIYLNNSNFILNILLRLQFTIMMQETEQKGKKFEPHFPVTKIKKIIQENQQIGKLSNLVPPLIEQSLQYFLIELIKKSDQVASEHGASKLTPAILKNALLSLQKSYDFIKDALDDVDDIIAPTSTLKQKSSQKAPKRSKSETEIKGTENEQKKGRKRVKVQDSEQSPSEEDQEG